MINFEGKIDWRKIDPRNKSNQNSCHQNYKETNMTLKSIRRKPGKIHTSPWMIVGAVIILLIIVVVLAIQNINREKRYMSQILSEKGAALIRAVEAGARTGMMGMRWGGRQVQTLLEETARQPHILYLAVTNKSGLILAHSDPAKIGQHFTGALSLTLLDLTKKEHWRLRDDENGRRAFEVYRYFQPLANTLHPMHKGVSPMMKRHGMMTCWRDDWCFPSNRAGNEQIIFVGMDVAPFEDARKEDIRNTLIISSVLMLLGFGGFLCLFWAQSYQTTHQQLQDTSAFADEIVTNLPVGLIATGRDGKIAFFNAAAEKITGLKLKEARGKEPDTVLPSQWCGLKEVLDRGEPILEQDMECAFTQRKAVPVSVSASQIINEAGQFVGYILILRDLGEIRRLQEEIRRKEKLAALGGLAAGVAHEIRNPLSSIKGLASYFKSKFVDGSEDKEAANVMIQEVERLNRVISELLEFARPSELKLKPTAINDVLAHSVRLIQQDAQTKNIEIHFSPTPEQLRAFVDPDRFSQCLLNLFLNAIQAMDDGGILSVKSLLGDNGMIQIEIADTGKGIQPQDINHVFDPYFTTKLKGTGLGLAIVHKIIEAHHGTIKVRSTPAKGTVFNIFIPLEKESESKKGVRYDSR